GPRGCEGRRSAAESHWREPGRRRQREPRVRRPASRLATEPLAEGGFVYRRSLLAAVLAALVLVPSALAARVHVRVEGKTQTIFGTTEPTLNVTATALDSLETASLAGELYYHVPNTAAAPDVDHS